MPKKDRLCRKKSIGSRVIDGKAYLVSLDQAAQSSDAFFSLNSTGTRIWSLINSRNNISDIAVKLCEEFSLKPSAARKEVSSFVGRLRKKGLLQ